MNSKPVSRKIKAVIDEMLIHRELYNPNKFPVVLTRKFEMDEYILKSGIPLGPKKISLLHDQFTHLPHGYYKVESVNGPEIFDMIMTFGDQIGRGNKRPSVPIPDVKLDRARSDFEA